MNSFELNKIAASLLVALLVSMSGSLLSDFFFSSEPLAKNILTLDSTTPSPQEMDHKNQLHPITPLLTQGNAEKGKTIAKKCLQCHTLEKGGHALTGPNLWGIIGQQFAHAVGFPYSQGFQEKRGKGIWDVEELNKFLYKPREYVPGTKMSFLGIQDEKERVDLITYLMTLKEGA